ncbi:MAG: hypothetical protein PVSMB1_18540 [Gemmatimonadaceae bacterium]
MAVPIRLKLTLWIFDHLLWDTCASSNILRIAGGLVRFNTRSEGNVGSTAVWMI